MSAPELITDHAERAFDNLPYELKNGEFLTELIKSVLLPEIQELEEFAFALISERTLDGAKGAQLDQLGIIVGEPRNGLNDDEYRSFIRARILTNLGEGEASRLIDVLATITGGSVFYQLTAPASFWIQYVADQPFSEAFRDRIATQVGSLTPAGVGYTVVETGAGYFGFDDDPDALGFDLGILSEEVS